MIPNRDLTYLISTDCRPRADKGRLVTMRGEELLQYPLEDYDLDNRLHLVSFESKRNIQSYITYFELLTKISNQESSRPEMQGRYVAMLDMGYVPLVAPPSFMSEQIYDFFKPLLEKSGIDIREQKPMRVDGRSFDAKANDIWGSRMDIAEYLKCDLTEVRPLTFLLEVMKRCV